MVLALAVAAAVAADPTVPHLAQAWQAMSTGDGLPGKTGLESYIYEDCKDKSDTCMNGHVFNYGADTCIKYEVDRGIHSQFSGTYYVKCDSLNCCTKGKHQIPNVKKWDIGQAGPLLNDKVTYLGKKDTTGLNNEPVTGADTYFEEFDIPFAKLKANYTYYVTMNGTDVITHRIQYGVQGQTAGVILYGDFKVQHNLTEFRSLFEAPAECLKPNTLTCPSDKMEEWDRKYFNKAK